LGYLFEQSIEEQIVYAVGWRNFGKEGAIGTFGVAKGNMHIE